MNGSYYQTPVFINDMERDTTQGMNYNMEQSYIENILRNNIGKKVRVHASFSDSVEWRDRVFVGIIERAGRDNLIINDIDNLDAVSGSTISSNGIKNIVRKVLSEVNKNEG